MKFPIYSALILLLASACSGVVLPAAVEPTPSGEQPEAATTPTSDDIYEIRAWVSNPNPERDELVTIYGNLAKHGVILGGIQMMATWGGYEKAPTIPDCVVTIIYQRGVCTVSASDFPSGEYVPITILINYDGQKFITQTGFTPK
jgi:hypothetical protein